jgi:hypothetical protein
MLESIRPPAYANTLVIAQSRSMPKRSNEFQRLVSRIFEQLAPRGIIVQESILLPESREGSDLREVDTLLTVDLGFTALKVAIESRHHARKQTVEWIDELAGKYRQLDVNHVIAVSRSGFTEKAMRKAADCGIQLFSLEEALDNDWPTTFLKLGVTGLTLTHLHSEVEYHLEKSSLPADFFRDAILSHTAQHGAVIEMPLREFIGALRAKIIEEAEGRLRENFLGIYNTKEDLGKNLVAEREVELPSSHLIGQGISVLIRKIAIKVHFSSEVEEGAVAHMAFNQIQSATPAAIVTSADIFGIPLNVIQTQSADRRVFP